MPFWQMMTARKAPTLDSLLSAFLEPSHVTFTTAQRGQCYSLMIPMTKSKWVEITHSSILAWRIPWTEELGGLQFMGSQRVRHD